MPSLQTALPPELANNVIRLYLECLRRAKYIGHKKHNTELIMSTVRQQFKNCLIIVQKHNTELIMSMVRQQFKKHMHETDPEKIQKLKDDAARGLKTTCYMSLRRCLDVNLARALDVV